MLLHRLSISVFLIGQRWRGALFPVKIFCSEQLKIDCSVGTTILILEAPWQ